MTEFTGALRSTPNLRRAVITSAVVGPILTLINQTPALVAIARGESVAAVTWLRIALTFVVPFVVALVSAALADAKRDAHTR